MAETHRDNGDANVVRFQSWNPYVPRDMSAGAADDPIDAQGRLYLPDGEPPPTGWPGVVIAQGLGGPKPHREMAYGRWLAARGYAALVLDSFGSRGIHGLDTWKALRLTTAMMVADAFGALRFMAEHPEIDGGRVAIKGYSYGGMVALITAFEPIRRLFMPPGRKFAGHIAYYSCSIVRMQNPETTGAPLLIMIGSRDRNVSVERTEKIADDLRQGGSEVDLKVFDCFHQWDGNDVEPRRVGFNLRHCHVAVDEGGRLFEEESGRKIDGPLSRFMFLARNASLGGYLIQQDKRISEKSNEALLAFLAERVRGDENRREAS